MNRQYSAVGLPWRSGIGTDVTDCKTAREVMEKVGLNFTVDKCELVAKMPFRLGPGMNTIEEDKGFAYGGNIYRDCPNAYATYRTDKNIPLGIVKQKYEVVQNMDAFNFFDDAIGPDKAIWQTAGCFGFGHKIFISAKLPIETTVKGDKIDNYLVFSNSHDGSCSVNIMFTPIRVMCTNMLNGALKSSDSFIRFRHTQSVGQRLQQGTELLRIACSHAKDAQQLYEVLAMAKVSDDQVMKYIAGLELTDAEYAKLMQYDENTVFRRLFGGDYRVIDEIELSTRKFNKMVTMFDYYQNGVAQKNIAGTWWGAYNGITGYYSNVDNKQGEKRMDALLYGSVNNSMNKALNVAFDVIRAA